MDKEADSAGAGIVEMSYNRLRSWNCGKAVFAFPQAVNEVFHSFIASYTHFHDAVFDEKLTNRREVS